jgi:ribosomal protein L37E
MKMTKAKRKKLPPHWYSIYIEYCPLCGHSRETRTRHYGKKPEIWMHNGRINPEVRDFNEVWDYCNAL